MAEDEQTLGAAVQMIMETMSDSVSQLVLLVVSLQEQNAALPPGLPPAATAVAGAASTLTEVVRALAEEEYSDFLDIKESILNAADDTDSAATGLVKAVEVIKTSNDRKAGWNGLMEACRVISGNTIRVLQIVYGAQLRRLLCVANLTQGLLDGIDLATLRTDPQQFADNMGDVVGKVGDLGAYTSQKAQDEESPVTKAEYATKGSELTAQSDELLAVTNELLQDTENPAVVEKFLQVVEATKSNVQSLMPTIHEQVAQLADETPAEEGEGEGAHQVAPLPESIQAAERALGQLTTAIIHSDPSEIAVSLKLLSASVSDIADYCTHSRDSRAQEHLNEIQAALPELIMHARHALDGDISDETRIQINTDTERIRIGLDALGTAVIEPGDHIAGVVERQLACLDALAESASLEDAQNVVASLKQIAATQNKLVPLVHQYAAENTESKSELDKAIAELEALLPQNVTAAKGFLQDTANPQTQHRLYEVIDVMRAPLYAVAAIINNSAYKQVGALESRQHANAVLLHNASTTPNTITAAKSINVTAKGFAQQATLMAETTTDSQTRSQLERSVNTLNTLLEAHATAQTELEKDPKNEDARRRLNNASEALLARTSALASELHNISVVQDVLRQAVVNKNSKDVEAALTELDRSINDTVSLARAGVVGTENDENTEWLRASLAVLDDAVVEQRTAARVAVATGNTTDLDGAMESVSSQIGVIRSQSTKNVAGKPSDERLVDKAVMTCSKAIDQLEQSSLANDGNNAAAAARALVDALALATQHAKESAQNKDQATRERVDDAIARADAKVAALLLATRESMNGDGDKVGLSIAAEEARRAVAELANAVVLPAEELLVSAQQQHRARTKTLRDTVAKHKDGKASDVDVANALRGTIESGKQVLDALNALEKDDNSHSHTASKVEKHLAGLIAAEKVSKEGGARGHKASASAIHLAEQITQDSDEAVQGMVPQVVGEAKAMENALDRLSNILADSSTTPDPAKISKAVKEIVEHERALETHLKKATAQVPAHARGMGATLSQALTEDLLARAVEASLAVAKDPNNVEARLAALAAVAEVRAVAAALVDTYKDVHSNEYKDKELDADAVEAAWALNEMIPDLIKITQHVSNNPSADANKTLGAAIDAIEGTILNFVEAADGSRDRNPISDSIGKVLNDLGRMSEGVSSADAIIVVEEIKAIAADLPSIIDQVNQSAEDTENTNSAVIKEVAAELASQLPELIEESKKYLKNTKSQEAKKDVLRSTTAMSNNLHQLRTLVKPKPADKVDHLASKLAKQTDDLAKLPATRNKENVSKALLNIKRTAGQLKTEAEKTPEFLDPNRRARVAAAIAQLENKIQEKQGGPSDLETSATALTSDPTNKSKQNNFQENLKFFQEACAAVPKATGGPNGLSAKARRETQQVNSLARSARAGDPKGVVQFAREAAATQMDIVEKTRSEAQTNKANSGKLNAAADSLEKNLSQCVVAAKGVLQEPGNSSKQDALDTSVAEITASLATIAAATGPSSPLSDIEATAADQSAALLALKDDPNDDRLRKVAENQVKLSELIKQEAANPHLPKQTVNALAADLSELEKTMGVVQSSLKSGKSDELASACLAAQPPLTRIIDTIATTQLQSEDQNPPVVGNAREKAEILLAALKQGKSGKFDPSTILSSSQHLARSLGDLVGHAKVQAYLARDSGTLSETAEKALALDELLTSLATVGVTMNSSSQPAAINSSMDSLISSIGNEQLATITAPSLQEESPAAPEPLKPKKKKELVPVTATHKPTLDESLKQVANEIRAAPVTKTASGETSTASSSSHSLATELERLATAAIHNKRQDVLVCGRTIAVLVNQICEAMRQTAKESTNPLVQDKLIKSAQALKNFAIQTKILASVKAASSVDDSDADEQLGTLTRSLGNVLGEGLKAIDIHHKTSKKPK